MKKFKTIGSKTLTVMLIVSTLSSFFPQDALAANTKVRQEINILDGYLMSPSGSYATSTEVINIDTTKYSGATFYLEAVASTSASQASNIYLKRISGETVSTLAIPTLTTTYTRLRSSSFSPSTGSNDYVLVIGNESSASASKGAIAARIVILQDTASLDSTETQIEIGNRETYSTAQATTTFASPKYWYYDSTKWSGTPTFYAEVSLRAINGIASSTAYNTSGTYTVAYVSGTASTTVELIGGGGAGGPAVANPSGGDGGAGGQYAKSSVVPRNTGSHTLVVAATTAGCTSGTCSAGADSTWDTSLVVAKGGSGGGEKAASTTGSTTGCVGDVCYAGGNGGKGTNTYGAGGGGGAGTTGTGNSATGAGVAGVAKNLAGGAGAAKNTTSKTNGNTGNTAGGGGGGAFRAGSGGTLTGGTGAQGKATTTNYIATTTVVLQVDNGSFGSWTDVPGTYMVTASSVGHGTSTRFRSSSFTPTTGRNYRIAFRNGDSRTSFQISNAKIIADQARYVLGTTYDSLSKSVSAQDNTPTGVYFKSDGSKMYITGDTSDTIYQYSLSSPWDVSTAASETSYNVSAQTTAPWQVAFSSDGFTMYVPDVTATPRILQYTLGTAWNVSTAVFSNSYTITQGSGGIRNAFFNSDGSRMYVYRGNATIYQYDLGTVWDVTSAVYNSVSLSVSPYSGNGNSGGYTLDSTGTKLYFSSYGQGQGKIYQFTLSSAGDLATAVDDQASFTVQSQESQVFGLHLGSSDTKFYVVGGSSDTVYQYTVGPLVTKFETQYLVSPTKLVSGTALQNYKTYWDSTEWSTSNVYIHQMEAGASSGSAAGLYNNPAGSLVVGSTITSPNNRATSTSMTMPATGDIDVKATTNNNDVYANRILVQVDATPANTSPTVTTSSASSITQTTATLNGNITATGGSSPTVRGFAWGTNSSLSGGDTATTTENGTFGTGAFTGSLSTLTCNTTYYSRAYATNSVGTSYGAISSSFTTTACNPTVTTQSASSVGQTSATLNGNITATGGSNATVRGFAWGTNSSLSGGDTATTTENGTFGTGAFTNSSLTLVCNTTYYSRAYATNPGGTSYGAISSSFTTSACSPTVTTQSASSITATGATLNGNITATGGSSPTVRGFAWGTNSSLSGGDTATTTENGTFGTGAFTNSSLTLVCNTTYYSRAYATNSGGTGYGAISSSFTTSACPASSSNSRSHGGASTNVGGETTGTGNQTTGGGAGGAATTTPGGEGTGTGGQNTGGGAGGGTGDLGFFQTRIFSLLSKLFFISEYKLSLVDIFRLR